MKEVINLLTLAATFFSIGRAQADTFCTEKALIDSFTCPFSAEMCGAPERTLVLPSDDNDVSVTAYQIQTAPSFTQQHVCNYVIEGPPDAQDGDYLYLSLEQLDLESVEAVIAIS